MEENEVYVYLFTGFLESGKTSLIQGTIEEPDFMKGETGLLICCEEGEVDATVFDRYRVPLYKEASYKPYVIAAMIFLSKFKNPVETLKEVERKGTDRVQP